MAGVGEVKMCGLVGIAVAGWGCWGWVEGRSLIEKKVGTFVWKFVEVCDRLAECNRVAGGGEGLRYKVSRK